MQPQNNKKEMERGFVLCVCECFIDINLFAGDILKILARHDASEFGFNKALCPLSLWRPDKD